MSDKAAVIGIATGHSGSLKKTLRDFGMLISLAAIMVFFEVATNGTLLRPVNLTNLVLQNSYIVIMALGMLMVIVTGHIDLSVGSVSGFIGAMAAVLIVQFNVNPVLAVVLCLCAGGAIGAAQGYWVAYFKIPSFIVTLAGMLVFRGMTLAVLGGASVGPFPTAFQHMSSGFIPDLIGPPTAPHWTSAILGVVMALLLVYLNLKNRSAQQEHGINTEPFGLFVLKNALLVTIITYFSYLLATYRGLPNVLVVMLGLIGVYAFVTNRTTIGRQIYAVGGNEKAARLSGIKTSRLTFFTFVNMGALAALAGLVYAARLNTATPKGGTSLELDVIAACFIGGASAYGGVGRVTGAVIGAFIMGVMNNGMSIVGLGIDYQQVIKGLVLLGAVCIDVYNQRR